MQKKVYRVPEVSVQRVALESSLLAGSPIKAEVKVKPFEEYSGPDIDDFTLEF